MNAKRSTNAARADSLPPDAAPLPDALPDVSLSFEAAQAELEQIVRDMESGEAGRSGPAATALSLEDSLKAYQRGMQLLRHCQQQLTDAETRVRLLENDGSLRPLSSAAPESP